MGTAFTIPEAITVMVLFDAAQEISGLCGSAGHNVGEGTLEVDVHFWLLLCCIETFHFVIVIVRGFLRATVTLGNQLL